MSLLHSNAVLQALSSFTGAAVKHKTEETEPGNELHVHNFLPTTFAKQPGDEPDSLFDELYVDMKTFLDPNFDFDFTDLKDNSTCMRGNEPYTRPTGWKRVAIKVLDKYPDGNGWLGSAGWRSQSVNGEWPVSYYGTSMDTCKTIVETHFKPSEPQSPNFSRRGIYSMYDLDEAAKYSNTFKDVDTGKTYKVLLQNRINPDKRKVCENKKYWLIEVPEGTLPAKEKKIVEESIRPYGILFKEV